MEKEYNMNLCKKYEVEFVKDGAVYKKGEKAMVNMALASKFYQDGRITVPNELREDAKASGCEDLFPVKGKTAKTEE